MPNPKKPRQPCMNCGNEVKEVAAKYCSPQRQADHRYKQLIISWKNGEVSGGKADDVVSGYVRRYLRERDGEKCSRCGWNERHPITRRVPLEVDHINGNHQDHSEPNLRLLCPNCHSLTPTYRALNKGNGRVARRERLKTK